MGRAAVNFKAQGEREKSAWRDHSKDSSARSIALNKSCSALAFQILSMREEVSPADYYPMCRLRLCASMQPRC